MKQRPSGKQIAGWRHAMTLHYGDNVINGLPVTVVKRRARRIIIRVRPGGDVAVTIPSGRATLAEAAAFLAAQWEWVMRARARAANAPTASEPTPATLEMLARQISQLHETWCARLGTGKVAWGLRRMTSRWGVCHWLARRVTYSKMLAGKPMDEIEYVVVHELTHLAVHGHGPEFKRLMDARLPGWRERRRRLNGRA